MTRSVQFHETRAIFCAITTSCSLGEQVDVCGHQVLLIGVDNKRVDPFRGVDRSRTVPSTHAYCLPDVPLPARLAWRVGVLASSCWRLSLRWCLGLLCGVLLSSNCAAWDAQKMLSAARARSPEALAGVQALQALLNRAALYDEKEKMQAVNEFFNRRILFQDDIQVWAVEDYWATPIELLEKGRGDCEDYAIAKYFSLLSLGVPVSKLRLVYVQARMGGVLQAHLVLAYYEHAAADPMILDNLVTELRPATLRPDLTPVFSFNSEGLWQGVGAQSAGDPLVRLSRWRGVLGKVRGEGFQ